MTPWIVDLQAPLSMGFSRQEYWSGLPFLPPGDLPNPGIKATSPALASGFFTTEPAGKPLHIPAKPLPVQTPAPGSNYTHFWVKPPALLLQGPQCPMQGCFTSAAMLGEGRS